MCVYYKYNMCTMSILLTQKVLSDKCIPIYFAYVHSLV